MSPLSDRCFTNIFSRGENFLCGFSFHFCLFGDKCMCVCLFVLMKVFFFKVWSTDLLTKSFTWYLRLTLPIKTFNTHLINGPKPCMLKMHKQFHL